MIRRVALVSLGIVVLAGVVACTPQPAAAPRPSHSREPWVMPTIVGDSVSSSPFETDEWVAAARKARLSYVLASNAADFSIEPVRASMTEKAAQLSYEHFLSWGTGEDGPLIWPGPPVLLPLGVDILDEDHAKVTFCDGSDYWVDQDESRLSQGVIATTTLVRTADGVRREYDATSRTSCDATGAPIARFDPAPQPLGPITEADVIPPTGSGAGGE